MIQNRQFLTELSKLSKQANHLAMFYKTIRSKIEGSKENNVQRDITSEIVKIYYHYKLIFSKSKDPQKRLRKIYGMLENSVDGNRAKISTVTRRKRELKKEAEFGKNKKLNEAVSILQPNYDNERSLCEFSNSNEQFICEYCKIIFRSRNTLSNHIKIHRRTMHKCSAPGCDYETNQAFLLRRHKTVHSRERPFKCSWNDCSSTFKNESTLRDHVKRHENYQQFICSQIGCEKRFNSIQNRNYHIKTVHSKEK